MLFIVSDYTIEACVMEPKPWDYSVDKSLRETNQNYLTADRQLVVNLLMPYFVIKRDSTDTLLCSAEVQIIDISSSFIYINIFY